MEQNALTRNTQFNDLFNRAVEQLANDSLPVRLRAIYTLIGLSKSYPELRYSVSQILQATLRERKSGDGIEPGLDEKEIVAYLIDQLPEDEDG